MVLSGWEAVFFWVFAFAALFTALLTILSRSAVHCALFLISCLISIGALYILLGAEFVAGAQILVYIGGVMVLFLFVIMLVNISKEESNKSMIFNSKRQVITTTVFCLLITFAFVFAINRGVKGLYDGNKSKNTIPQEELLNTGATNKILISKNTEEVGGSLYRFASLPFEIASVLLLVAIVGSVLLARTPKQESETEN